MTQHTDSGLRPADQGVSPQQTAEANAEYIAKACNAYPQMLEALRDVVRIQIHTVGQRRAVNKARAVLATIDKGE